MSHRRMRRRLRRIALGLALVSAFSAGRVAVATAKVHEGVPVQAAPLRQERQETLPERGGTLDRGEALLVVVGSASLVLGLGLALGYIRRPRLAGH